MHTDIESFSMPDPAAVEEAADTLRILSDPTRIRILWALSQGESSVACLAELAETTPTAVSQHLAKLRLAGIVRARREGTFMYYAVVDEQVARVLESVLGSTPRATRGPSTDRVASGL
jgi:DNA-binding transcriptional ArsR family regulator